MGAREMGWGVVEVRADRPVRGLLLGLHLHITCPWTRGQGRGRGRMATPALLCSHYILTGTSLEVRCLSVDSRYLSTNSLRRCFIVADDVVLLLPFSMVGGCAACGL